MERQSTVASTAVDVRSATGVAVAEVNTTSDLPLIIAGQVKKAIEECDVAAFEACFGIGAGQTYIGDEKRRAVSVLFRAIKLKLASDWAVKPYASTTGADGSVTELLGPINYLFVYQGKDNALQVWFDLGLPFVFTESDRLYPNLGFYLLCSPRIQDMHYASIANLLSISLQRLSKHDLLQTMHGQTLLSTTLRYASNYFIHHSKVHTVAMFAGTLKQVVNTYRHALPDVFDAEIEKRREGGTIFDIMVKKASATSTRHAKLTGRDVLINIEAIAQVKAELIFNIRVLSILLNSYEYKRCAIPFKKPNKMRELLLSLMREHPSNFGAEDISVDGFIAAQKGVLERRRGGLLLRRYDGCDTMEYLAAEEDELEAGAWVARSVTLLFSEDGLGLGNTDSSSDIPCDVDEDEFVPELDTTGVCIGKNTPHRS